tara:strand:- start:780 stop:1013 length:234 start_codon:yes stop_codon:yes gene_type:complete
MSEIKKKLDDIFFVILKLPKKKDKSEVNFKNVRKWDSLAHVNLLLSIESTFGIKIDPDDGIKLLSYKSIIKYLKKKF